MTDGTAIRILMIEDDDGDATHLQITLRKSQGEYEFHRAESLTEGIALAQKIDFRVILTDLNLPDSFGLGSVQQLSELFDNTAIIVLSGQDQEQLYIDAVSKGAESFLCKSEITPTTVHRCIRQSIERIKQREEIKRLVDAVQNQALVLETQSAQLKTKNERLERLHDSSQKFVNNVSHEFRTPLCVVKQYASLIADGVVGAVSEEQCRMLRVIEDRVDDLNNIVDDMLDISRHESGLLAANRETCDSSPIVTHILSGLQQRASLRGISIDFHADETETPIFCDAEKVSRTLINLIVNAIKFSSAGDSIVVTISSSERDREVTFAVRDSGPGIEPEQREQIFSRFRQANTQLLSSTKGFGLGLNIAKELVDLNLGQMSLVSSVGEGSTFAFTVPFDDPQTVAQRYFTRLQNIDADASVCMIRIEAEIDSELSQRAEEIHLLLNYLLHSHDLLIKTGPTTWLVIQHANPESATSFLTRIEKETTSLNRNRPQGPLPKLHIQQQGTFSIHIGIEALMKEILCEVENTSPPFDWNQDQCEVNHV
ncbi:hybrid sensor histidine kinase/response regulator [Novipirellula sp. SH528]|uniref:hybrid sensor histidine kinase/response regulator n=1 Tax=Novipirellula sp. SH528 TaxID=3454466 RepID=UPI003FA0D48F